MQRVYSDIKLCLGGISEDGSALEKNTRWSDMNVINVKIRFSTLNSINTFVRLKIPSNPKDF